MSGRESMSKDGENRYICETGQDGTGKKLSLLAVLKAVLKKGLPKLYFYHDWKY